MDNMMKTAALFEILCQKYFRAEDLGKKVAQKIFYFYERLGIDLGLKYGIHYYGPYSSKLDDRMYYLKSEGYININEDGLTHIITCGRKKAEEGILSEEERKIAEETLHIFGEKTPLELEALSTMDFIDNTILSSPTDEELLSKFYLIKGTKFDQREAEKTLNNLREIAVLS